MDKTEQLNLMVRTDPDFVALSRYGCSLKKVMSRFPNGVEALMAAQALNMPIEEFEELINIAILKLRDRLGVDSDED